jgi:type II secretory pathway pseudopilin PulG
MTDLTSKLHWSSRGSQGFSLVEVVLALGIVTFVIVALIGLLPVGLRQASDSEKETRAVNILGAIAADRASSPAASNSTVYQIPALTLPGNGASSNSFGVKETGEYVGSDFSEAHYRISYVLRPPSTGNLDPWRIFFRVAWPAGETNAPSTVETIISLTQ